MEQNLTVEASRKCGMSRRVVAASLAGAGAALAGASTTFATPPTPDETAGAALEDLGDRGVTWVTTYALPAAITVLGIGLVLGLVVKFGKRVRGWI